MKKFRPEQIVEKLRQAAVELGKGLGVKEVCRLIEISEQTYYRWRQKYGGLSPAGRRRTVVYLVDRLGYSRWRICRAIGQAWSSQRYEKQVDMDERCLVAAMRRLAVIWPRFGYRRIAVLLQQEGWRVNDKRVHRLWKDEGLQIRKKQRKRRRMGTSANACHRRKPRYKDHVWGYDFVS